MGMHFSMLQQNSLQQNIYTISLGDKKLYDCSTSIWKDKKDNSKFNE